MPNSSLGVVVVSYNTSDVILHCLETLFSAAAQDGTTLRVVVVDNASQDNSLGIIADWASGKAGYSVPDDMPMAFQPAAKPIPTYQSGQVESSLDLIAAGGNEGFASGVNIGLAHLFANPDIDRVWVLNPDSVVPAGTPAAFHLAPQTEFSLMGGRVIYYETPEIIQIDGGTLNTKTGVTGNINLFAPIASPFPKAEQLDFITGASMVASRQFYETVGPMQEDYFLYYEEVDWAMQRGSLPLAVCPEAVVYHRGGSAIGSAVYGRPASPFSLYFKHRARMKYVRRHNPTSLPIAWAYSLAKAGQFFLKGWKEEAGATLSGALGRKPSPQILKRLAPETARKLFGG